MKRKILWISLGIILGIVLTLLALAGIGYYVYQQEQAEYQAQLEAVEANKTESSTPDVSAYHDLTACPDADPQMLEGKWIGEKTFPSGSWQRWELNRSGDGNYRIRFTYRKPDGSEETSTEGGLWSYAHCLYTVITKAVDGKPYFAQEVYRVHEINDEAMRYTNFRTGTTYEVRRNNSSDASY